MADIEADKCWHLMITTEGGKVSMLQNLDAPTARQAYQKLLPGQRPVKYLNRPEGPFIHNVGCFSIRDEDIRKVDILGPEGVDLDPWRGVEPRIIDLAPELERQEMMRKEREQEEADLRSFKTTDDVISGWYDRCVAKYPEATITAADLYDGVSGRTLARFASNYAPDGVNITQKDMERWLEKKGHRSRGAMFAKRYDGIRQIIYGDVRTGNYGT